MKRSSIRNILIRLSQAIILIEFIFITRHIYLLNKNPAYLPTGIAFIILNIATIGLMLINLSVLDYKFRRK